MLKCKQFVNNFGFLRFCPAFPGTKCVFRPIYGRYFFMFQNNISNFYGFLPMLLACDDKYRNLSARGCFLYSLMLSRMNLSERNKDRFSDEKGVFIYFSLDEVSKYLNCSKPTSIATMQELISLGLVTRGECAKGKSPKYYVKKLEKMDSRPKQQEEKQESFDVQKAEKIANEDTFDFGSMKQKDFYNFAEKKKRRSF